MVLLKYSFSWLSFIAIVLTKSILIYLLVKALEASACSVADVLHGPIWYLQEGGYLLVTHIMF